MKNQDYETMEKWRKDPNNWKFGLFYYNPEDTRIFPPKRIKWMGMTINFANKMSVFIFSLCILLALLAIFFYAPPKH